MEENKKNKIPNVPTLRFNFDGEYTQVLIGDYIVQKGKRAKGNELKYTAYSINNQTGFSVQQEQWGDASYTKLEKNGYKVIEYNDFAYNPARINVGSIGLYKEKTPCIVSSLYVCFAAKSKFDPDYLFKYLKSDKFNKKVLSTQEGGVRTYFFYDKLQKTKIYIPSLPEQYKINEFFDLINRRIEAQNKIISNIESLIKQINDDVFNKAKNCSMKDCIIELSIRNKDGKINNVLSVSNKLGFIKQSEQFEDKEVASDDKTKYKIVQNETFAYNPARINVGSIALYTKAEDGIVSPMYTCFKSKSGLEKILEMFFKSQSFKKEMNKRLEGSVRMCLTIDAMKNIKFHMPDSQEQKILSLVEKLVEKKILENNLLNTYLKQKEYLLSNLFI